MIASISPAKILEGPSLDENSCLWTSSQSSVHSSESSESSRRFCRLPPPVRRPRPRVPPPRGLAVALGRRTGSPSSLRETVARFVVVVVTTVVVSIAERQEAAVLSGNKIGKTRAKASKLVSGSFVIIATAAFIVIFTR